MRLGEYCVALAVFLCVASAATFYEILEVKQDASDSDIYIAYKRLLEKYDPEKNPGDPDCHQRYIDVERAYNVLKSQ